MHILSLANLKEETHDVKPLPSYNTGTVLTSAHGLNAKSALVRSEIKVIFF